MSIQNAKTKHRSWNPTTLQLLTERGLAAGSRCECVNVFYTDNKTDLDALVQSLIEHRYTVKVDQSAQVGNGKKQWSVNASLSIPLEPQELHEMTDNCVEIANRHRSEYDGWFVELNL